MLLPFITNIKVGTQFEDMERALENISLGMKVCSLLYYRVSQKKGGLVFWAQFWGLNGLKSKSGREQTPIKI